MERRGRRRKRKLIFLMLSVSEKEKASPLLRGKISHMRLQIKSNRKKCGCQQFIHLFNTTERPVCLASCQKLKFSGIQ